ncbi:CD166 antigen homolog isoform X3 [Boleophthalmus pectinirostris]|uniref:CD166 antigen homolog isoform X3 n=1 Tax=Boleophthalmus pectinirostris TaxID=150288 RepID=UPI00242BA870|nr:CD166 antigen homolog isoform X3 [Boleophthalmus pectinirostris]
MGPVCALLLLLHIAQAQATGSTVAVAESFCDARVNLTRCFGALGGTIKIQLMDNGSTTPRCIWKKNTENIFEWKNNAVRTNKFPDRLVFNNITGIIQIQNLTKSDSDSYSLEFYNKDGHLTKMIIHQLITEVPVSSLLLDFKCVSKGEVRVSCDAQGGGNPEYSWTLNGQNLTDSELVSKNNETVVTLRQNTEGLLRCSVKNNVSHKFKESHVTNCDFEPTTYLPIIAGSLVVVLIIGMVIVCVLKKRKKKRDEELDQELTYADVRVLRQPDRRPQRASEGEVEYGQVKFSNHGPVVSVEEDNACIYAKVRR